MNHYISLGLYMGVDYDKIDIVKPTNNNRSN